MGIELLAFIFVMSTSIVATQSETCDIGEGDVCPTIISNQVTIASIQQDMETVVERVTAQLQRNSEETQALLTVLNRNSTNEEDAAVMEALRTCQTQVEDQNYEVKELQRKRKEAIQATETRVNQQEQLRQDIEALNQKKTSSIEKIKCLKEQIEQQKMQIAEQSIAAHLPMDCADLQVMGKTANGVYTIYPNQTEQYSVEVQCDFEIDGGGWTIFLNRIPQDVPETFDRSWKEFKNGFGESSAEYWIGNDFLHTITSYDGTSLRIDASIFTGEKRFAVYDNFLVENEENKYKLTLEGYQTESTLGDSLASNNGQYFSTFDRDNDPLDYYHCAAGSSYSAVAGAGWWYSTCGLTRITAPLVNTGDYDSARWSNWEPNAESIVSLQTLSVKMRRHNYRELAHVSDTL